MTSPPASETVDCGCGLSYPPEAFARLPPPSSGRTVMDVPAGDDGPAYRLEMRNCSCGSTIARELPDGSAP